MFHQNFEKLFAVNDVVQGGSFYLQSKIFRAKQALEEDVTIQQKTKEQDEETATSTSQSAKHTDTDKRA